MLFKRGSKGLYVQAIQLSLNTWSGDSLKPLAPDGILGPLTEGRVRDFQKAYPLVVDGIVGPNTFSHLFTGVQLTAEVNGRTGAGSMPSPASSTPAASTPGAPKLDLSDGGRYRFPMGDYPFMRPVRPNWLSLLDPPVEPLLSPLQRQQLNGTFSQIHFGNVWSLPQFFPPMPAPVPPPGLTVPPLRLDPIPSPDAPTTKTAKKSKDVSHLGARFDFTFDPNADYQLSLGTVLVFGLLGPPDKSKLNVELATRPPFQIAGQGSRLWTFQATAAFKPFQLKPLPWLKLSPIILSSINPNSFQVFAGGKAAMNFKLSEQLFLEIGGKFGPKYEFTFDPKKGKSHHKVKPFTGTGSLSLGWRW
ncbi:MAG: hypothetical protein GVY13_18015 [Alphaproteobacteria bacterium]|jgi:peptidoglycan hydrolase-like protein with peptidoglycan-binding domain|nr:hypothetical protein [Alphaproteobacteria bacterium]